MANTGFYCMDGYLKRTERLTDEELGRLFRACMVYHATGELTELDGRESIAFDFIREDIDAANQAYEAKCEINRRNRNGATVTVTTTADEMPRPTTTVDDRARPTTNGPKTNTNTNTKEKEKRENDARAREERFERFWAAYPRHEAKQKALAAFEKLRPDEDMLTRMLQAIERQRASDQWREDGGRFIPHPTTWLNGRRWEDEVRPGTTGKAVSAQRYDQRSYAGREQDALERFIQQSEEGIP